MLAPFCMLRRLSLRRHLLVALLAAAWGAALWLAALLGVVLYAAPPLDRGALLLPQNIQIVDRYGGQLSRYYDDVDRTMLRAEDMAPLLRKAVVAIEDERFFTRRSCIDVRSVLRAALHNLRSDDVQGGSTVTQQLVRNLYLSPEQTLRRKVQEAWLACRMERTLSKEEILTLYMNRVNFGGAVEGVGQAARTYFGTDASSLTAAQIAVLAALPQQPSGFLPGGPRERTTVSHDAVRRLRAGDMRPNDLGADDVRTGLLGRTLMTPRGPVRVPGRSDAVLSLLAAQGLLSQGALANAHAELQRMQLRRMAPEPAATHFSSAMHAEVRRLLAGVERPEQWIRAGITVHTTLDPTVQRAAEHAVALHLPSVRAQGGKDIAVVVLARDTREVLAYVGNAATPENAATAAIDMAAAPRQPGSAVKPLLYAFAFERGLTPDSPVDDTPLSVGNDTPKNYEGGFRGRMTVRAALAQSRNIPAIRTFLALDDEDGFLAFLARAGAPTPLAAKRAALAANRWFAYGWPLAIGSAELPLIELTNAYATLADAGASRATAGVCRIAGRGGETLITPPSSAQVRAVDPTAALWTTDILEDASARPAGFWRDILTLPGRVSGAKTGTSNVCLQRTFGGDCLSYAAGTVWTVGYDAAFVVGVLAGNADGTPMSPTADGLTVAAPVWRSIMEQLGTRNGAPASCR